MAEWARRLGMEVWALRRLLWAVAFLSPSAVLGEYRYAVAMECRALGYTWAAAARALGYSDAPTLLRMVRRMERRPRLARKVSETATVPSGSATFRQHARRP